MNTSVNPGDALSRRQLAVYVVVLGTLTALGPFTIDLYLPAFPRIETDLGVTTSMVQLTLTATALGFALGQLIVGPWSDRVGRRRPMLLATSVHILASLGVAVAPNFELLMLCRVLQGAGAAAGSVVATAMVRDLFGGYPLVHMLSRLALVSGLAPIIAPVIGAQLLLVMPWRGVFLVLAGYGLLVVLASAFWIVETLPPERRGARGRTTKQRYHALFADRQFMGIAIIGGMVFSGLFAYLSSSSFLFQDVYGLDPQAYGLLFALNSVGIVIGVQTSARLAKHVGPQWILAVATSVLFVLALAIVVLDQLGAGFYGVLIPLWLFIATCGFCFPCVQVLALADHGAEAGTAASLLGAINFGLAGALSPLIGLFGITNAVPMGVMMMGTSTVAVASLWLLVRPRTVAALAH